jgi:hypothetical protein
MKKEGVVSMKNNEKIFSSCPHCKENTENGAATSKPAPRGASPYPHTCHIYCKKCGKCKTEGCSFNGKFVDI